jgi:hypothetical protein
MTEFGRNETNALAEHFRSTADADKEAAFTHMSPDNRAAYLLQLRGITRSDASRRDISVLWNVERKLTRLDEELRHAGR